MSITVKTKYWITTSLLLILGIFFSGWYLGHKKTESALNATIMAQHKEIQRYVVKIGDDNRYITSIEQEVLSQREAIKQGALLREELRKLNYRQASEITRLKIRIDTLIKNIPHDGTLVHIDTIMIEGKPKNAILLPFEFTKKDQFLDLKGNFDPLGNLSINLKMDTIRLDVWTGQARKIKEYTTIITSDNPYLDVIDIRSQKFDLPRQKRYGVGIMVGYGITSREPMKPSVMVGIGLSYNFIRF